MKAVKTLIIVGDRVLIDLDERQNRTGGGLYLPPTVKEKEKVQGGYIIRTGPGYPVHDPNTVLEEPWSTGKKHETRYFPLQATEGDYALFLKEAGIEVEYEGKQYIVVPHSAILLLVRTDVVEEVREGYEHFHE